MNIICPQCGFSRMVPQDKLPSGSVIARCPKCACRFRFSREKGVGEIVPPKGSAPEEEDIRVTASNAYLREANRFENEQKKNALLREKELSRNPWDAAPEPAGWVSAFYQTVLRVMFQAPLFFRNLSANAQIWKPLAFFMIICIFQTLVERVWANVLYSFLAESATTDPELQNLLRLISPSTSLLLLLLLRSGALLAQLFICALLMYFAYRIVAPERAKFMLVYQALTYSAAPWLLCIIPGIGSLAGTIWGIGCLAAGCRAAMNLSWAQTFTGFLPLIALLAPILPQLAQHFG